MSPLFAGANVGVCALPPQWRRSDQSRRYSHNMRLPPWATRMGIESQQAGSCVLQNSFLQDGKPTIGARRLWFSARRIVYMADMTHLFVSCPPITAFFDISHRLLYSAFQMLIHLSFLIHLMPIKLCLDGQRTGIDLLLVNSSARLWSLFLFSSPPTARTLLVGWLLLKDCYQLTETNDMCERPMAKSHSCTQASTSTSISHS